MADTRFKLAASNEDELHQFRSKKDYMNPMALQHYARQFRKKARAQQQKAQSQPDLSDPGTMAAGRGSIPWFQPSVATVVTEPSAFMTGSSLSDQLIPTVGSIDMEAPIPVTIDSTRPAGNSNYLALKEIFLSPLSLLLLFVPLGLLAEPLGMSDGVCFWSNFFALMPLAKVLGDATEHLADALQNDAISALLNATFGNAVELIVAIQTLRQGLTNVVKESLLGSVLSNILLVLGMSFLFGGLTPSARDKERASQADLRKEVGMLAIEKEQIFGVKSALASMGMLLFSSMCFTLPTIFQAAQTTDTGSELIVSRIGSVFAGATYVAYILWQLVTHPATLRRDEERAGRGLVHQASDAPPDDGEGEGEGEGEGLAAWAAVLLMILCTLAVSFCSDGLVSVLKPVADAYHIPQPFIGMILLPIVGNACEHAGAVRFFMQDECNLGIGIAIGSSTQIALLVVPVSVLAGWVLDKPMDLNFGMMNCGVLTLSVLVVLTLLLDGRSHWLKGYMLMSAYAFIAVLYWFLPEGARAT